VFFCEIPFARLSERSFQSFTNFFTLLFAESLASFLTTTALSLSSFGLTVLSFGDFRRFSAFYLSSSESATSGNPNSVIVNFLTKESAVGTLSMI